MPWSKPDFVEITLCMEVTAYVNTDDDQKVVSGQWPVARQEEAIASVTTDD